MREQQQIELSLPRQVAEVEADAFEGDTEDVNTLTRTMLHSYALYRQGLSVAEIAQRRNCTSATVEEHLIGCLRAGHAVDTGKFVSAGERVLIEAAIAEHGSSRLKPIHEALPDTISYNMIRFVIADRLRNEQTTAASA
jgi:uncharacterized protein YpbB